MREKRRLRRRRAKIRIMKLKMSHALKNNQPINNRIPEKFKKNKFSVDYTSAILSLFI